MWLFVIHKINKYIYIFPFINCKFFFLKCKRRNPTSAACTCPDPLGLPPYHRNINISFQAV